MAGHASSPGVGGEGEGGEWGAARGRHGGAVGGGGGAQPMAARFGPARAVCVRKKTWGRKEREEREKEKERKKWKIDKSGNFRGEK
jgi:hypothetical protein